MVAPPLEIERTLTAAVARRSAAVAAALDDERVLHRARAWAARAVPDAAVEGVRVRSVLYRPDGSCTMRYLVRLAPSGEERILLVEVPSSGTCVRVRPFPADPGLPTLAHALDPGLMRTVLGRVVPGTGGERAVGRCAVDVVRYPREGRCVLRYRFSPGAGGAGELRHPVVFGKVYGSHDPRAAAAGSRLLRRGLARASGPVRVTVPRPLGVVAPLRLGLAEAVPGRALLPDLVRAGDPGPLSAALTTAAGAAAAVHACSTDGAALPVRCLAGELASADREVTLLEPVWPEAAASLRRGLAPAEAFGSAEPLAPAVAHGDFTPGQVLLDGDGTAAIVDVDTLCLAEPALDLGRFLAYLQVAAVRRASRPLPAEVTGRFADAYLDATASRDGRRLLLDRTAAYAGLSLARMGVSACRQLKDDRLAAVRTVLDSGDDWRRNAG